MKAHKVLESIETGATLDSATAVGGNEGIHKGNMGAELQANTLGGKQPADWDQSVNSDIGRHHEINMLGLVGWYPFVMGAGSTLYDFSTVGGTHNGTITGATWGAGESGNGLVFDGSSDYVDTSLTPATGDMPRTSMAWLKTSAAGVNQRFFSYGTNSNSEKYDIRVDASNGDGLRVENAGGNITGDTALTTGSWVHVAVVFPNSGSNVIDHDLYVNGSKDTIFQSTSQSMNTTTTYDLRIGESHFHGNTLDGSLSDVRLYNRDLSGAEITDIMNGVA